jgi:YebC/PmpR family DNA-binding regulatory protein
MSGHNRWSKVKNVKGPADAKRGKLFTKVIKELTVAARAGGGSPEGNPRLRQAILAAKAASMPKENIDRAIKRGTGELADGVAIEENLYEGYGPGGVAVLVETTSDNRNRTVNDLRNLFKSHGGNLGEAGSVSWMFTRFGQLVFDKARHPEDQIMEVALEAGAQDVASGSEAVEVLTGPNEVYVVREAFERVGMHPTSAGFSYVAKTSVPVDSRPDAERLLKLLEAIEDHDDVQRVHANFEMDDKLIAELTSK